MSFGEKAILKALDLLNPDKSAGKTLMYINAAGIGFAAASNTFAASIDKNTSAEDKKFLVPAGAATGFANLAIYFGMTNKLVDYLEKDVADKVKDLKISNKTFEQGVDTFVKSKILKAEKSESKEFVESLKATLKNPDGSLSNTAKQLYTKNISKGLGVVGAFIGAIVGCAIITPILRDVSAYAVQKAREAKDPSLKDKPYRPYFDISHVRANSQPYGKPNHQPLSLTNYMNFTHGRTRV